MKNARCYCVKCGQVFEGRVSECRTCGGSQEVMAKIQREWSVQIQKLDMATAEKKGTVVIEFAIE
jgi:Zn finger protein HypA/HybF involved in hydrogenase expression